MGSGAVATDVGWIGMGSGPGSAGTKSRVRTIVAKGEDVALK
jgi:hypothetical protein